MCLASALVGWVAETAVTVVCVVCMVGTSVVDCCYVLFTCNVLWFVCRLGDRFIDDNVVMVV